MQYTASAECPNCGERTKWGTCEILLPNGKVCGGTEFMPLQRQSGGYACTLCSTRYEYRECEHCGGVIPDTFYKKKGWFSR